MATDPLQQREPVVTDKRQLVEYMAGGCKPEVEWRIGTEHEKLVYRREDFRAPPTTNPAASARSSTG